MRAGAGRRAEPQRLLGRGWGGCGRLKQRAANPEGHLHGCHPRHSAQITSFSHHLGPVSQDFTDDKRRREIKEPAPMTKCQTHPRFYILALVCMRISWGTWLYSVGLGLGPKLRIAKELPPDANAADPWVSFIILNTLLFGSSSTFLFSIKLLQMVQCVGNNFS